jgi:hypothetical protein
MHLKIFVKLKKARKNPLVWAKKPKKNQKNPKKPTGLGFLKKTRVFSNPAKNSSKQCTNFLNFLILVSKHESYWPVYTSNRSNRFYDNVEQSLDGWLEALFNIVWYANLPDSLMAFKPGLWIRIRIILGAGSGSIREKNWIRIRIKTKFRSCRSSKLSHEGPWALTMERWWVFRPVDVDSHHFDEDPRKVESGFSLEWKEGSWSALK